MLDHAGEILMAFVGAWRFALSRSYRDMKLADWGAAHATWHGRIVIAAEIVVATAMGVLLPLWLIALVIMSRWK